MTDTILENILEELKKLEISVENKDLNSYLVHSTLILTAFCLTFILILHFIIFIKSTRFQCHVTQLEAEVAEEAPLIEEEEGRLASVLIYPSTVTQG